MDDRSNRDLKGALARGEFTPRKRAFAREIMWCVWRKGVPPSLSVSFV